MPKRRSSPSSLLLLRITGIFCVLSVVVVAISWIQLHRVDMQKADRVVVLEVTPIQDIATLYIFDFVYQSYKALEIPLDLKIPLAYGYGQYPLKSVEQLGNQEGIGLDLLEKSVSYWLGINIDGTIVIKTNESNQNSVQRYVQAHSTLDRWQKIWYWQVLQRTMSKVDTISYQDASEEALGTLVYSELIAQTNHQVVIVNATGTAGLASDLADILKGLGYDVISLQDTQEMRSITTLQNDPDIQLEEYFATPLLELLPVTNFEPVENLLEMYRGDIVIFIGDDFKNQFSR